MARTAPDTPTRRVSQSPDGGRENTGAGPERRLCVRRLFVAGNLAACGIETQRTGSAARGSAADAYFSQSILSVAVPSGMVIRSPDAHVKRRPRHDSSSFTMLTGLHVSGHHGRGSLNSICGIVH